MREQWTGSPEQVLARHYRQANLEDGREERAWAERVGMARERAQDVADAFRWEGVPIPSIEAQIAEVLQRGHAGRDAEIDREAERVRSERLVQREGEVVALTLAGRMPRTPQETMALFAASCAVEDAAQARAERAEREARGARPAPFDVSYEGLRKAQAERKAQAAATPAYLADVGEVESKLNQTISKLKAKLHAQGSLRP